MVLRRKTIRRKRTHRTQRNQRGGAHKWCPTAANSASAVNAAADAEACIVELLVQIRDAVLEKQATVIGTLAPKDAAAQGHGEFNLLAELNNNVSYAVNPAATEIILTFKSVSTTDLVVDEMNRGREIGPKTPQKVTYSISPTGDITAAYDPAAANNFWQHYETEIISVLNENKIDVA